MIVQDNDTIAVWFSCGVASAVAAKKTVEKYGANCTVRIMNNPVLEEDADNRRFLQNVEKWIGITIEIVTSVDYPNQSAVEVWDKRKYMSGTKGAPCTQILKKKTRQHWESINKHDWIVLGFTADEKHRYDRFIQTERANTLPVLIEEGITKEDCFKIIQDAGIQIPAIYYMGYPNANCIGCVKATSPTYWNHVREMHPEIFQQRAIQSRKLKCRLTRVKGKRLFLDELSPTAKGLPMKNMKIDCGIFCEEKIKQP